MFRCFNVNNFSNIYIKWSGMELLNIMTEFLLNCELDPYQRM